MSTVTMVRATTPSSSPWLLFLHQLPPKPSYVRVKVWRRLQALGAIAVKSSVWVLPDTAQAREGLEWLCREAVKAGGEASICEARFVEGLRDGQIEELFNKEREADYRELADRLRSLDELLPERRRPAPETLAEVTAGRARARRRLADLLAIDFFGATGRDAVEGLLAKLSRRLEQSPRALRSEDPAIYRGRTWVTRRGVHIDRIGSAWLIRRFIDPAACFKFVPGRGYEPASGEVRFDMFEAEFTHDGDLCTFETLLSRFGIRDRALKAIAEVIHDIDLRDGKFARAESTGIDHLIAGLALSVRDDAERIARGAVLLDDLYAYFSRRGGRQGGEKP